MLPRRFPWFDALNCKEQIGSVDELDTEPVEEHEDEEEDRRKATLRQI